MKQLFDIKKRNLQIISIRRNVKFFFDIKITKEIVEKISEK